MSSATNHKSRAAGKAAKAANKIARKRAAKAAPTSHAHARSTVKSAPSRAKRFLTNNPVRVLLGAAATILVAAKLKQRLA